MVWGMRKREYNLKKEEQTGVCSDTESAVQVQRRDVEESHSGLPRRTIDQMARGCFPPLPLDRDRGMEQ